MGESRGNTGPKSPGTIARPGHYAWLGLIARNIAAASYANCSAKNAAPAKVEGGMRRHWSCEEDAQIVKLKRSGLSSEEIAEALSASGRIRTVRAVRGRMQELGIRNVTP